MQLMGSVCLEGSKDRTMSAKRSSLWHFSHGSVLPPIAGLVAWGHARDGVATNGNVA